MFGIRVIVIALAITVLSVVVAGSGPLAWADEPTASSAIADPGELADVELLEAFEAVDLLDAWFEATNRAPATAMLRVEGDDLYDASRAVAIAQAQEMAQAFEIAKQLDDLRSERAKLNREYADLITESILDGPALAANAAAIESIDEKVVKLLFSSAVANIDIDAARNEVLASIGTLHSLRANAVSSVDDLPLAVLDAYISAADSAPASCSMNWTLLAGIGRIESLHGTLDGSLVSSDGGTWPHIFGPLLDGGATERQLAEEAAAEQAVLEVEAEPDPADLSPIERYPDLYGPLLGLDPVETDAETDLADNADETGAAQDTAQEGPEDATVDEEASDEGDEDDEDEGNGFAVIEDTDAGALDGNSSWDRAIGPMQFIPGTWSLFDTDGNGDGWADPHNFYDAAASAATYLCHLRDRNGADPWTFIRGYNNSSAYVADVIETSDRLSASYQLPSLTPVDAA